ncbi:hypothetical protein AB6A40_008873 [Gnathostoma spinigerum]|uniref:Uncharacterized protein n=1 Tax=Gnathostoma spinigerum TaxID=75299 RepID=A0ABD6EVE6_9BILA
MNEERGMREEEGLRSAASCLESGMREEEGMEGLATSYESGIREEEGMRSSASCSESGIREEEGMRSSADISEGLQLYIFEHEQQYASYFMWMGVLQFFGALITLLKCAKDVVIIYYNSYVYDDLEHLMWRVNHMMKMREQLYPRLRLIITATSSL